MVVGEVLHALETPGLVPSGIGYTAMTADELSVSDIQQASGSCFLCRSVFKFQRRVMQS
jgi:hypothetical protein